MSKLMVTSTIFLISNLCDPSGISAESGDKAVYSNRNLLHHRKPVYNVEYNLNKFLR